MISTFGELMLRISPKDSAERILEATDFEIRPGGSEANVAVALAALGEKAAFITSLPDNALGEKVLRQLKKAGVNTAFINKINDRLGIYWTENGLGPRNSFVIYDREDAAFSKSKYTDFDWEKILGKSKWFHFSGISPALSEEVARVLEKLVEKITTPYSVDLNFRSKLWNWIEKDPERINTIMTTLCQSAQMMAGNESDFQNVFGFDGQSDSEEEKYNDIAKQCFGQFPKLKYLAISSRISHSATLNDWSGYLFVRSDEKFCYKSIEYRLESIADRVGTGDSFVAGIIYGLNHKSEMDWQQIIDFAATLGALNHTTKGDFSTFCKEEVDAALKTRGSGRIVR